MGREAYARSLALLLLLGTLAGAAAESAPDFALPTVDGHNIRLSEYRGEVVVVAFWSSRCGDCDRHVAYLAELVRRFDDQGARLLVVSIDRQPEAARELASRLGSAVAFDLEREVAGLYDLGRLPVVHLVDHHGRLRSARGGAQSRDLSDYEQALLALLNE